MSHHRVARQDVTHLTAEERFFLQCCHLILGFRKLEPGWEYRDLAKRIGCRREYLSGVLSGDRPLSRRMAKALAKHLRMGEVFLEWAHALPQRKKPKRKQNQNNLGDGH